MPVVHHVPSAPPASRKIPMETKVPTTAAELISLYKFHLPRADNNVQFRVTKLGMSMLVTEFERLQEVEKSYDELKAHRMAGRPPGRPRKEDGE